MQINPTKKAIIIGATGLIGSRLLRRLQNDNTIGRILVLSHRMVELKGPKTDVQVIDFSDMDRLRSAIDGNNVLFCTVGTTRKKAGGDKEIYRKVDFDIPVNAAHLCAEMGCKQFLLVSSVGADSNSNNFYLSLKGEVEDAIKASDVTSVSIFRPSVLLGDRKESRPGETIGKFLMSTFSFLLPPRMKPIDAEEVAEAMVIIARQGRAGYNVYQYDEIKKESQNYKSNHS